MCPEAQEYLDDGIRSQKLGVHDRALESFMTAAALAESPEMRAQALIHQANLLRERCQWESAIGVAQQARLVALEARLPTLVGESFLAEANVHLARGELDEALPVFHRLLDHAIDARLRGLALQNVGTIHAQQGTLDMAEAAFSASYTFFERAGYLRGQAIARNNQGRARLDGGDVEGAGRVLEEALALAREAEDRELVASTLVNLAEALLPSDAERAEGLACTALGHSQMSGSPLRQVEALRLLGDIHARRGHREEAEKLWVRALAIARPVQAQVEIAALEARLQGLSSA